MQHVIVSGYQFQLGNQVSCHIRETIKEVQDCALLHSTHAHMYAMI